MPTTVRSNPQFDPYPPVSRVCSNYFSVKLIQRLHENYFIIFKLPSHRREPALTISMKAIFFYPHVLCPVLTQSHAQRPPLKVIKLVKIFSAFYKARLITVFTRFNHLIIPEPVQSISHFQTSYKLTGFLTNLVSRNYYFEKIFIFHTVH